MKSLGVLGLMGLVMMPSNSIYDFTMKTLEGKNFSFAQLKGKVLLAVNVASKCGLTPQYAGLESLHRKYKDRGLVVLGFPANDFANQEPGSEAEIAEFCKANYDVTFPLFEKISVKGDNMHPLFKWLVSNSQSKSEVEWNFAKFLVGRNGKLVARFHPRTKPDDPALVEAIERELTKG